MAIFHSLSSNISVLSLLVLVLFALPCIYGTKSFDTIYSLGDSLTDTGNLVAEGNLGQFSAIVYLPYGISIGMATGRCSDGLLMIDFIAEHLGLSYLQPYLFKDVEFKNGVNFAVAGATALDTSYLSSKGIPIPYTNSSLNVQLEWFNTHLKSVCSSDSECKEKLSNALFILGEIGGNDYNYAFLGHTSILEVTSLVPSVVQTIVDVARKLIEKGARHIVVPGNFPIGCSASYLTLYQTDDPLAYDDRKCLISFNSFAEIHNKLLQKALQPLREEFPDVDIKYADLYNAALKLVDDASTSSGSQNVLSACCGAGGYYNFNPAQMCGNNGTTVCEDLPIHMNWDGIHLTQHAYKNIVSQLVGDKIFD